MANKERKPMIDSDFEHNSRAHLFCNEWQAAADRAGDAQRLEGDEMNDYIVSIYPEWALVIAPDKDIDFYQMGQDEREKMLQGK